MDYMSISEILTGIKNWVLQKAELKQDKLTFDTVPTAGSSNPVTSGGVHNAISNFVTITVDNLLNYYLKTETYTKAEVQALIGAINQFHYEIYPTRADVTDPQSNVLYLIGPIGTGSDKYEEYVYPNSTAGFVKIGDTSIDLSGYVTTEALNTALAAYTTTAELTTLLAGKEDKSNKVTTITDASTDTQYSSAKAVWTAITSAVSTAISTVKSWAEGKFELLTNKVTILSSSSTDTQYPSAKCVYDFVVGSGIAKEVLTVTASADSGSISSAVLTVKANGETLKTGTGSITVAIDFGTEYTVEAARVNDYLTPAVQSFTAGQSVRNVTMAYTYIPRDTITLDQTESVDTSMITGDVQGDVIKAIRAASHLYLGTQTESGNQLICQLKDNEGAKYADGSAAALDGTEGDHWLKLPVFWYKVTPIGTADANGAYDKYSFSFAFAGEPDSTWKKWNGDKNLLGAHKMYVNDSKGYSRSGIVGSANFTQPNGKTYARARGTGYTTVTWEWHCMMCVLFYAWYGRTNAQAQCGTGSNSNTRTLGTKDSLGMTDTTSANGNADNTKFWGIENWWGDINEWIDNITSSNYALTVVGQDDGVSRSAGAIVACAGTGGWQSRMKISENLDMVPVAKEGTETTYYCDWVNANTGSRVVYRSYYIAYTYGGVACVGAHYDSSSAYTVVGSRLAFNGTIVEAESVAAYKAALNG